MSKASPREDSGTHARRREVDSMLGFAAVDEEERGRSSEVVEDERTASGGGAGFCWMRAMKPGMLSFADGVGWTYTYSQRAVSNGGAGNGVIILTLLFENNNLTPFPVLVCRIVLYSPSSSSLMA